MRRCYPRPSPPLDQGYSCDALPPYQAVTCLLVDIASPCLDNPSRVLRFNVTSFASAHSTGSGFAEPLAPPFTAAHTTLNGAGYVDATTATDDPVRLLAQCLLGGAYDPDYDYYRLWVEWSWDCVNNLMAWSIALGDAFGTYSIGGQMVFSDSTESQWGTLNPFVLPFSLIMEGETTPAAGEVRIRRTCTDDCVHGRCWDDCILTECPEGNVAAQLLFWDLECDGSTGTHSGQFDWGGTGGGSGSEQYSAGDWPFGGVPTISCVDGIPTLDNLTLFGVTYGPLSLSLICVGGNASWRKSFEDPAGGGSGGGPGEICWLRIYTNL